jgi:putative ATP-dependent endonuclease of the OLD family
VKLHRLRIEGYKRIEAATVLFGDATFMIGPNNTGKSSVLAAITHLLSALKRIPEVEYYSVHDEATNERKTISNKIVFEAEFRNVPVDARTWRGFKGRVFEYDTGDSGETGLCLTYRKTYELGKDVVIELKSKTRSMKPQYENATKPQELIDAGVNAELVRESFDDLEKKLTVATKGKLQEIDDLWDIGTEETWFQNPGGIPGIVLSRLPRYIIIPADTASGEMSGSGVLPKTLNELFEDVRGASHNYLEAQRFLNELAKEMDPSDANSEFGKMLIELNGIIASVFPDSKIHARADLSDPDKSLKPTFTVELQSNIRTPVDHQGAGMVRSAVFGILRFRQKWLSRREDQGIKRSIIIGFEEPEMYLHPSAANQMRDTIYDLSTQDSQILATTHSPYLIDLSRKPRQVLNRFAIAGGAIQIQSFNVTDVYRSLLDEDKDYVKMIMKVDDYVARVFFTKRIVIVEGDTEDIVIRETLRRLPREKRLAVLATTEIIKARGKAAIIGLAKYLKAMGITPTVIHDRDAGVAGAEKFNAPIEASVGKENVIQLCECLEDVLGYVPPTNEKPYAAYSVAKGWGSQWDDVPAAWRATIEKAFDIG